jgi:hypothetical protein
MKAILYGLVGATLAAGAACAQTTPTTPRPGTVQVPPRAPAQVMPNTGANTTGNAYSGTATVNTPNDSTTNGKAAASGDTNQAVATTRQNADTPARGANSFTQGEALNRMASKGYSNISGLSKNNDGIWEGKADKSGHQVTVWLDYKGNVGEHAL